jgi:glycosyltransferase involved in cell wall biosynthesis
MGFFIKSYKISKQSFNLIIIGENKNIKVEEIKNRKIFSLGKINNDIKISEILNCADLIVIPSKIDNLPQTGLEAQSCGLPVVTFNCKG